MVVYFVEGLVRMGVETSRPVSRRNDLPRQGAGSSSGIVVAVPVLFQPLVAASKEPLGISGRWNP